LNTGSYGWARIPQHSHCNSTLQAGGFSGAWMGQDSTALALQFLFAGQRFQWWAFWGAMDVGVTGSGSSCLGDAKVVNVSIPGLWFALACPAARIQEPEDKRDEQWILSDRVEYCPPIVPYKTWTVHGPETIYGRRVPLPPPAGLAYLPDLRRVGRGCVPWNARRLNRPPPPMQSVQPQRRLTKKSNQVVARCSGIYGPHCTVCPTRIAVAQEGLVNSTIV
jgi:hypothetical protein